MLQHQDPVGRRNRDRATGSPFADNDRDQRHADGETLFGGARDRLGLTPFFRLHAWKSAGRIDECHRWFFAGLNVAAVLSVITVIWSLAVVVDFQGASWQGEPTEAQIWEQRWIQAAQSIPGPATILAVSATLGIIVIGAASAQEHYRSTRTMSAAGSTENRAAVTTPNSSPSISTSWGSPSIEMSTDRPRP